MSYHKENPRYMANILSPNHTKEATPWLARWEREFESSRWIVIDHMYYPIRSMRRVAGLVVADPLERRKASYHSYGKK